MIVAYGNNGVLVLGIVETDVEILHGGRTLAFERGPQFLTTDIIVVYGRDKAHLIQQFKDAGVTVSEAMQADYLAGRRTDNPRQPS
jgi:hypothetical protein